MPTNVTPEYRAAEHRYKTASAPEDQLEALQEMLSVIPKHKGTEKLQADLKAKMARLRKEVGQPGKTGARQKPFYHVDRAEGGQAVLVGPPNSGKSSLLAALTSARPDVGDYPYTTQAPMPGMMAYEDTQLQLVDLPPVIPGASEGWLYEIVRHAELVLLVVDANDDDVLSETDEVLGALAEHSIELVPVDADEPGTAVRALLVANKVDSEHAEEDLDILREFFGDRLPILPVSAETGKNVERLRQAVFDGLRVIRIYTKSPHEPAVPTKPFLLSRGSTVLDAARAVHGDLAEDMKFARIWGTGHYEGQMVSRDDVLRDQDLVEIHT